MTGTGQWRESGRAEGLLVLVALSTLGAVITGGAFYAFSTFAMPALGLLPDRDAIRAMQQINITVINPWFMIPLFGPALTGIATLLWVLVDRDSDYGPWLLVGSLLYLVGCVGVTMAFNVPRNEQLARTDASAPEATLVWRAYLREWTAWNSVRTAAALAAGGCLVVGMVLA